MTLSNNTVASVAVGEKAPEFSLPAYPEGTVSLKDFQGSKNVILAFYPKDDTPGCTKEMCAFSEDLGKFQSADCEVLGISVDSVKSHEKFAAKYTLKQTLLADADGDVAKLYGVVREGKSSAARVLFIMDKQGIVRHIHEGMPTNDELLSLLSDLK